MSELKITGNPNPVVGKEELYSVNQLLPSLLPFKNWNDVATNPFELPVEWSVHTLEKGRWIKKEENNKTGYKVSYKFIQKSLERKGIRILAKRGEQTARLNITPHKAESPKINSIEFLDYNGKVPTKPFAYGQTLKVRVHCLHMEKRTVYATLWEDDAAGAGHDKANEKNKMKTLPGTVKDGIADIDFVLEPDFAKIADAMKAKGDSDEGKTHEYYVTAEILNKKTASKNTNVANPNYKDTAAKPATPKNKHPLRKRAFQKQEKEKSTGDDIIDWWEDKIKIKPIVLQNPIEAINSVLKIFQPDEKKEDENKKKDGCYCNIDLREQILQKLAPNASQKNLTKYIDGFNETFKKFSIDTCLKKLHFLAQVIHESGSFKYNVEQGNESYLAKYGGWHGRGLIQLTLRENYEAFEIYIGEDFTSSATNRDKVTNSPYAVYSAGWFWNNRNLNELSNSNDFIYITYKVNGGFNNIDDRLKNTKIGFAVLYNKCENDKGKTTDYKFSESKGYNNAKCSFAWGLWHDPLFTKDGCTKNKEKAIEGYQRYIDLTNENDKTTNYYGIEKYNHFNDLIVLTNRGKKKVKVRDAANKRINELR